MTPVDPNDAASAVKAGNSLIDHGEVLLRVGIISLISGLVGGTMAFIRDAHRRHIPYGKAMVFFYVSKVGFGCCSAYLALLVLPVFGLGTSVEVEQAVAVLSAMMGADFIGLLMRRVLGAQPSDPRWGGEERRGADYSGDTGGRGNA